MMPAGSKITIVHNGCAVQARVYAAYATSRRWLLAGPGKRAFAYEYILEGITWIPGHHALGSPELNALEVAYGLYVSRVA